MATGSTIYPILYIHIFSSVHEYLQLDHGVKFVDSATSGGILDRAIEAEDKKHGDFLRLVMLNFLAKLVSFHALFLVCESYLQHNTANIPCSQSCNHLAMACSSSFQEHVEGYLELSAKTKAYFTTAVALWDADFYVKVDDDVHVNIGKAASLLSLGFSYIQIHRSKYRNSRGNSS